MQIQIKIFAKSVQTNMENKLSKGWNVLFIKKREKERIASMTILDLKELKNYFSDVEIAELLKKSFTKEDLKNIKENL